MELDEIGCVGNFCGASYKIPNAPLKGWNFGLFKMRREKKRGTM